MVRNAVSGSDGVLVRSVPVTLYHVPRRTISEDMQETFAYDILVVIIRIRPFRLGR